MKNQVVLTELSVPDLQQLFRQEVETLLFNFKQQQTPSPLPQPEPEKLLTVQEAAELLNLTVGTIYTLNQQGSLPSCKRGKRLYFSSSELIDWVKQGRKKTAAEIEAAAAQYLNKKGAGAK